jgi:hypothetical protein
VDSFEDRAGEQARKENCGQRTGHLTMLVDLDKSPDTTCDLFAMFYMLRAH